MKNVFIDFVCAGLLLLESAVFGFLWANGFTDGSHLPFLLLGAGWLLYGVLCIMGIYSSVRPYKVPNPYMGWVIWDSFAGTVILGKTVWAIFLRSCVTTSVGITLLTLGGWGFIGTPVFIWCAVVFLPWIVWVLFNALSYIAFLMHAEA